MGRLSYPGTTGIGCPQVRRSGWPGPDERASLDGMTDVDARLRVQHLANQQHGVVSRAQARELGADHRKVAREVDAGRWATYGTRSLAVHRLDLPLAARARVAAWEAGEDAVLDGATSLWFGGLRNFDDGLHVLRPWPSHKRSYFGSVVHSSRLWAPDDFVDAGGVLRTSNPVAAVRAGMYARTDRAGALVMVMAVQQRLVTPEELLRQVERVNRHKRRPLLLTVALDVADGSRAMSELDFARLCRERNLPEPTRQTVRQNVLGRWYRDVEWEQYGVVVEVEGVHHDAPENAVEDSLRQNEFTIGSDSVLRLPVLGLRVMPDAFMNQVTRMLMNAGWRRSA